MNQRNSNASRPTILHFHVCVHCGSAFRREDFVGRTLTSGIFHCTKCDLDGPLNVEIRECIDGDWQGKQIKSVLGSGS